MVNVGTGKAGSRFLKTKWPITDGLTAGTTTQEGHEEYLEAQEGSTLFRKDQEGIN